MSQAVTRNGRMILVVMSGLIVVLAVLFAILSPWYVTADNLRNLLTGIAATGIVAMPAAFLLMAGHFDLSVGAAAAFAGVVMATAAPEWGLPGAVLLATGTGVAIGAVNGLLVTIGGISSLAVTFAMLSLLRALATLIPSGLSTPLSGFRTLGHAEPIPGVSLPALMFLGIAALAGVLSRTAAGRRSRAVGDRLLTKFPMTRGDRWWLVGLFVASGAAAALTGLIRTSQLGTGLPSAALGAEIVVINAVLLGSRRSSGGRGTVGGTLLAVVLMSVIDNGLSLLNTTPYLSPVIHAVLLVVALLISRPAGRERRLTVGTVMNPDHNPPIAVPTGSHLSAGLPSTPQAVVEVHGPQTPRNAGGELPSARG